MTSNRLAWFTVAIGVVGCGAATSGCGGSDPLPAAHSGSFYPVRGTADNGSTTGTLHWSYRINGGQPITSSSTPGLSIKFNDEDVTAQDGSTITYATDSTVGGSGATGHETLRQTDHLVPGSSPATVSSRDVSVVLSLSGSGTQVNTTEMIKYTFAPPQPTFFDRDDLDTLDVGFTESVSSTASYTASVSVSATGAPPQNETMSMSIPSTQSWTLLEKLATFDVLGRTYSNVVKVEEHGTTIDPSSGATVDESGPFWLAKGIGLIRAEEGGSVLSDFGTVTFELVNTNLMP